MQTATAYETSILGFDIGSADGTEQPIMYLTKQHPQVQSNIYSLVVQNEHDFSSSNKQVVDTHIFPFVVNKVTSDAIDIDELSGSFPLIMQGQSSPPTKTGIRNALLDDVNYIFSLNSQLDGTFNLDSFAVSFIKADDGNSFYEGIWGSPKQVRTLIPYLYGNMEVCRAVAGDDGAYLVHKYKADAVSDGLAIDFIQKGDLEGTNSPISSQQLYAFKNDDQSGFYTPDSHLYDVIVTPHMDTGKQVFIGVGDHNGALWSWYIGPGGKGGKELISADDVKKYFPDGIMSVILNEGTNPYDQTGVNNITAMIFGNTKKTDTGRLNMYSCALSTFATNKWNLIHTNTNTGQLKTMGYHPLTKTTVTLPIDGSSNYRSFLFYGCAHPGSGNDFHINEMPSNQLVPYDEKTVELSNSRQFNQTEYANMMIPVGFVDGPPPINKNGWDWATGVVQSQIQLSNSNKDTMQTSVSFKDSVSVGFSKGWQDINSGVDAEYAYTYGTTSRNSNTWSNITTDTLNMVSYNDKSVGTFYYLAPRIHTLSFNVTDFNGELSKTDPRTLYISTYAPDNPLVQMIAAYNLTNPGSTSWFSGMKSAPAYNNFENWSWATWSGGWTYRDWEENNASNPYLNQYEWTKFGDAPLIWYWGDDQTTGTTMETVNQYSSSQEQKVSVKDKIFGLTVGTTATYSLENTETYDNSKGVSFTYKNKIPNDDVCGMKTIYIQPLILTPKTGSLPWIPTVYSEYRPWLITYDVLGWDPSDGCSVTSSASALGSKESSIKTSIIPTGAGTITLPSGGIKKGSTGVVHAVPADGYEFLHWKGYGIDLDDYSSPTANATVTAAYSTLRAVFAKQSQDLIETGMIAIQNDTTGNQIKIQGKIPSGFSKHHALHLKNPVEVKVGDLTFPFGLSVGNVTVVSDHELAFTTTDSKKGISHLRVDFGSNTWWFAANQVEDLDEAGINSFLVNIGIGGKNLSVNEEVRMIGNEKISWSGLNEPVSNDVFSLQNATIEARFHFLKNSTEYDTFHLENGDLKVSSISSTDPLMFAIKAITLKFDNATSVNGNTLTYQKIGKDLNATITINNQTMVWNAELSGKRLAHHYVSSGLSIGLSVGNVSNSSVINPTQTTMLRTPNLAVSSDDVLFPQMNFGV